MWSSATVRLDKQNKTIVKALSGMHIWLKWKGINHSSNSAEIHNYRETMILGCTYTWGRLFEKEEYIYITEHHRK